MPIKPEWVIALEKAQDAIGVAAQQDSPEETDSKTRLAYAWMDVAKLLKGVD